MATVRVSEEVLRESAASLADERVTLELDAVTN